MSKIIFDSFIRPGDIVKITIYREDGTIEQEDQYDSDVYGNVVSLVTEDS